MSIRQVNPLADGVLFSHWLDIPIEGWADRWPNFKRHEFASKDSGETYYHPRTQDAIQRARDILGKGININSAHRSWIHNLAIGGAPRSAHLYIACDVSTSGHDRLTVFKALKKAGFTSFGFYLNFIHTDMRPDNRRWYAGPKAKAVWQPLLHPRVDFEL